MKIKTGILFCFMLIRCGAVLALQPDEILVIANRDIEESLQIARYYCEKRGISDENILALPLGVKLNDTISRSDYDKQLSEPIRERFLTRKLHGKIKCLLTVYGVPVTVGARGVLAGQKEALAALNDLAKLQKEKTERMKQDGLEGSKEYKQETGRLTRLQQRIGFICGAETGASVDSELSMVLFDSYELYRWQPNGLKEGGNDYLDLGSNTLMVSRLDGPGYAIVTGLIDKAIAAEKTGLKGVAYIDSRGLNGRDMYGRYDQSLCNLAGFTKSKTNIPVKEERGPDLFAPGTCPQAAIYCGWYSVGKYVDAFDFVQGAVGYHIASYEAIDLRDPNSSHWCPAMLKDGITATLGPVAEPYLHTFPEPREFFAKLYEGNCLVEAYYRTNPFNSWQLVLIGDPLYTPFKKPPWKE